MRSTTTVAPRRVPIGLIGASTVVALGLGLAAAVNPLLGLGGFVFLAAMFAFVRNGAVAVCAFAGTTYFDLIGEYTGASLSPIKLAGGALIVLAPIGAGCAAWKAGRYRRAGWPKRSWRRSPVRLALAEVTTTAGFQLAAYAAVGLTVATASTRARFPWEPQLFLVAAAALAGWASLGFVIGWWVRAELAMPVVVVGSYLAIVFPDAALKIFMDASPDERAQRRLKQLRAKGIEAKLAPLREEIRARDERDRNRPIAPLRPADGAEVVDTTGLSPADVLARVEVLLQGSGFVAPAAPRAD